MADVLVPNSSNKFSCEKCNYVCSRLSQYNRHLMTRKHEMLHTILTNADELVPLSSKLYKCKCGNSYKHRQSLYKHNLICSVTQDTNTNIVIDKSDLTQKLVELIMSKNQEFMTELVSNITSSNKEVMEKMMEIIPSIGNTTNSHNNTNSNNTNNNQFNIQMFLNEHCKNAMNLTDFIESLPITATTFDSTIENGLTKTVTTMITNGLSKLDILERPIHCTDATRKTLYVKEANVWEKDTELKKVLSGITNLIVKKRDLICEWKEANRGWDTIESKQIRFTELVCNIMTDVERDEKETGKIIRAISKTVYLDNEEKKKYLC